MYTIENFGGETLLEVESSTNGAKRR